MCWFFYYFTPLSLASRSRLHPGVPEGEILYSHLGIEFIPSRSKQSKRHGRVAGKFEKWMARIAHREIPSNQCFLLRNSDERLHFRLANFAARRRPAQKTVLTTQPSRHFNEAIIK